MNEVKLSNVVQDGGILKSTLRAQAEYFKRRDYSSMYSEEYLNGAIYVQLKVYNNCYGTTEYSIKVSKVHKNDGMKIALKVSSSTLDVFKSFDCENSGEFQFKVQDGKSGSTSFDIAIHTELVDTIGKFEALNNDTDLVDFELCGEGGSVAVHKVVLAASSPVLKKMLCGEWMETKTGKVNISGLSKTTLEHFKSYLYLKNIPYNSDFEELLLLAARYEIPGLEYYCIEKLVQCMNSANIVQLFNFAFKNQMLKLLLAIMDSFKKSNLNVMDIAKSEPFIS